MATYTRDDFVRQVLIDLRVLGADDAPDSADAKLANERTQQKFEELYEEGLIPFDLGGDIPARYFRPLCAIVTAELYGAFGRKADASFYEGKATLGIKRLWQLRQKPYVYSPTKAAYY